MGRSKSPVDDLVDGIDAIGTILDENLPAIKSMIDDLAGRQAVTTSDVGDLRRSVRNSDEILSDLKKSITNLDIRLEEVLATIGALSRRMDQIQKSILDLTVQSDTLPADEELSDTVKVLEDRLKRLEDKRKADDISRRF